MNFLRSLTAAALLASLGVTYAADNSAAALEQLVAVYRTQPQGYPSGKEYARPDTSVPFRWHSYHDGIDRFEKARMTSYVDPYNLLEDGGVIAEAPVKFSFVAAHVTAGQKSLRVDFPLAAIKAGTARVQVQCVATPVLNTYMKYRSAAYWSHYRWLKADVFNAAGKDVQVRVCGVPLVLPAGASTIAVKTADAVGHRGEYPAWFNAVPLVVTGPEQDVTLYLDNFRMEQEVPATIQAHGRFLQFAVKGDAGDAALLRWPGCTPIERDTLYTPERGFGWTEEAKKRQYGGLTFRSNENGLVWGRCRDADCPLRLDVPDGRYGVWVFAAPVHPSAWAKGLTASVNGQTQPLLPARSPEEVRRLALSGENWDYRPGACVWAELVRHVYFPKTALLSAEVKNGHMLLEFPPALALRAVAIFREQDRAAALQELGRLEYLLAESWDVAHAWVKGDFAEQGRYIGFHAEMTHPETIPARLAALKLGDADFRRGFMLFARGLTDAVYPDTIPTPAETKFERVTDFAAPGQSVCLSFGILPLAVREDLRLEVGELSGAAGTIPASALDVRVARYQQKCMEYGHHNHCYNYQEHYLVKRAKIALYPGCARRAYVDVAVPREARPGTYRGQARLLDGGGATVAAAALELEVVPVALETPPVFFGIDNGKDVAGLRKYGINFIGADHDTAVEHGFAGYAIWPYNAASPPFRGKRLGWNAFVKEKELLQDIIVAGKSGKGPRPFFGGYVKDRNSDGPFLTELVKELPGIDILGVTCPIYAFQGADYTHTGEPWAAQIRTRGKPDLLEEAGRSGKEFWFIDWLRHSKEQPARFTFGFWLWRLGAKGHFSTFTYGTDYHYGTAREAFDYVPYYTLLGVVGGNACRALQPGLAPGEWVPARDLLLIRAGIDDYRYIYTLERRIRDAEAKKVDTAAARRLRDELRNDLSLDLTRYYEARMASYAENWYPRADNPWNGTKFDRTRRAVADQILALQRAVGD